MTWRWSSPGAEARLRKRLAEGPPLDLAQVLALQREQTSERGVQAVRELLDGIELKSAHAVRLRTILREWDGRTDVESRGALVYHMFRRELVHELLRKGLGLRWGDEIAALAEPLPGVVLERFLDRTQLRATSSLVESAFEKTWRFLQAQVSANPSRWELGPAPSAPPCNTLSNDWVEGHFAGWGAGSAAGPTRSVAIRTPSGPCTTAARRRGETVWVPR